jgi:hypothetical protein
MKVLVMQSFTPSVSPSLFNPNILISTKFSNSRILFSNLNVRDQVSRPYRTTGKIVVFYILILMFSTSDEKTEGSWLMVFMHLRKTKSEYVQNLSMCRQKLEHGIIIFANQVFTALSMKTNLFWDVTPYSLVEIYWRFRRNIPPPSPGCKNEPSRARSKQTYPSLGTCDSAEASSFNIFLYTFFLNFFLLSPYSMPAGPPKLRVWHLCLARPNCSEHCRKFATS